MADFSLATQIQPPQIQTPGQMAQGAGQVQQLQKQNALRQVMQQPGAVGPDGSPSPNALKAISSIDPMMGSELQQNSLKTQGMRADLTQQKQKMVFTGLEPVLTDYESEVQKGTPDPVARANAQKKFTQVRDSFAQSGIFSDAEIKMMPTDFDPNRVRTGILGYKGQQELDIRRRAEGRLEAHTKTQEQLERERLANTERHQGIEEKRAGEESEERRRHNLVTESGDKFTWQPGEGKDDSGKVVPGSYRYSTKQDEPPKFFPGAVGTTRVGPAERDAETIANARITEEEKKRGAPLEEAEKARIRQSARLDPKIDEVKRKDEAHQIPQEVAQNIAEQYVETGNPMVLAGFRRSPAMIAQLEGEILAAQKRRNMTPKDVARQSAEFAAFQQGVKAFEAGGKLEPIVRSLSVATGHLGVLGEAADALNNKNMRLFNQLANEYAKQTGASAPTTFDGVKQLVAEELVKAVTGTAGALGDRAGIEKTLDKANSPKQLHDMVEDYKKMMAGQLDGLRITYGRLDTKKDFDQTFLSPEARKEVAKYAPAGRGEKDTASALPASIAKIPGLLRNKDGTKFQDPATGKIYDKDGKQVGEIKKAPAGG